MVLFLVILANAGHVRLFFSVFVYFILKGRNTFKLKVKVDFSPVSLKFRNLRLKKAEK